MKANKQHACLSDLRYSFAELIRNSLFPTSVSISVRRLNLPIVVLCTTIPLPVFDSTKGLWTVSPEYCAQYWFSVQQVLTYTEGMVHHPSKVLAKYSLFSPRQRTLREFDTLHRPQCYGNLINSEALAMLWVHRTLCSLDCCFYTSSHTQKRSKWTFSTQLLYQLLPRKHLQHTGIS